VSENELNDRVDGYFGVTDEKLRRVAQTLVRSGMEWTEAQRLMSDVYHVGYEEGWDDRGMEVCCG
jgi:hypothetical protein